MGFLNNKESISTDQSENTRVIIASILVGIMAGVATYLLKRGLDWFGSLILPHIRINQGNYQFLIIPVIGILIATLFQFLIKEDLDNGTERLKQKLSTGNLRMTVSRIFTPIIGCLFTIGLGGSAGAEGPSAFSGAAMGDNAARWFKLSPESARILFGCGAAAGIAGIFTAPIGGILFSIEVLGMGFSAVGLLALTCAAVSAFAITFTLSGFCWNVMIIHPQNFDYSQLGWVLILGIVAGLYSLYYRHTAHVAGVFFTKIPNRWLRALICGVCIAISIFLFPSMFGEGYQVVAKVVNGDKTPLLSFSPFSKESGSLLFLLTSLSCILLIKGAAVGATNNGGGVAGTFAPTIFAGALMGYLFAFATNKFFGANLSPEIFALIGTASVMAGALRAPLMAIFIAAEISDRYSFIIPFIAVSAISYLVATFTPRFYRNISRHHPIPAEVQKAKAENSKPQE